MNVPLFIRTYEIPVFCTDVILVIHDDFDEVDKKYNLGIREDFNGANPNENVCALTVLHPDSNKKAEIYVLFRPGELDVDTVTHESMHILNYICLETGVQYDVNNDEVFAYLQGYIMKKLCSGIVSFMDKSALDLRKFLLPK